MDSKVKNILIVGAGFSGVTVARVLAENDFNITIIDKRDHVGGNCFDYVDEKSGSLIHKYGPHIFHTQNEKVYDWVKQFGEWIPYKHKVKAILDNGQYVTLPPNHETCQVLGNKKNVLDVLFRPYTKKMWGLELDDISPDVIQRIAIRDDNNEFYFPDDKYQYLPKNGYTKIIKEILNHKNITINLNTEFEMDMEKDYFHIFNSMPIDVYYDFCFGELPYRSIKFHNVWLPSINLFPTSVVNFTHDLPYTRITDWSMFPNSLSNGDFNLYTYEEPCDYKENNNERYYPVKDILGENRDKFRKYHSINNDKVTFIGRCGLYVYINMDQAINSALATAKKFLNNENA